MKLHALNALLSLALVRETILLPDTSFYHAFWYFQSVPPGRPRQRTCHIQQAHGAEQLVAAKLGAKRAFDKGVIAERDANRTHSQGYLRFIKSQVPLNPYVVDKDNIDISAFDFLCLISHIPLQLSK